MQIMDQSVQIMVVLFQQWPALRESDYLSVWKIPPAVATTTPPRADVEEYVQRAREVPQA